MGFSALLVERISRVFSGVITSHIQPDPKVVMAVWVNSSLNLSILSKLALMADTRLSGIGISC